MALWPVPAHFIAFETSSITIALVHGKRMNDFQNNNYDSGIVDGYWAEFSWFEDGVVCTVTSWRLVTSSQQQQNDERSRHHCLGGDDQCRLLQRYDRGRLRTLELGVERTGLVCSS